MVVAVEGVSSETPDRTNTPSALVSGSPEYKRIIELEMQARENAYQEGNYQQVETVGNPSEGNIYKTSKPPANRSSNETYSNYSNTEYYGQTKPPQLTAREILAKRDQNRVVTSPPETTIKKPVDISRPQPKEIQYNSMGGASSKMVSVLIQKETPIEESENSLAKTNALRAKLGLQPLQDQYQVNEVIYPKGPAVTVSENTLKKSNELRAKENNPSLESVVPVKEVIYSKPVTTIETTSSNIQYVRTNDNPQKTAVASFIEPFLYTGLSLLALPATYLFNRNLFTKQPGPTTQEDVTGFIQKTIGVTPADQIMQGDIVSNDFTPAQKVTGLIASGAGIYVSSGGIGQGVKSYIANKLALFSLASKAKVISTGVQEGPLRSELGPVNNKGVTVKRAEVYTKTQGTEQESTIKGYKVENVEPYKVQTGETKPVETIGQIGTKKPSTFPEHNPPTDTQRFINNIKNKISPIQPGGNLKVASEPGEPATLGFTYKSDIENVAINASTKHTGSFTPENIADTINHETLHNVLQKTAGPEASKGLDLLAHESTITRTDLLRLGIEPGTLQPEFNIPANKAEIEQVIEANNAKEATLGKNEFIQNLEEKPVYGKVIKELPVEETVKPELPKYLKPTTEIETIGSKGERKMVEKPTEVSLEPETSGQAKKPLTLIGKSSTAVVRSEPQEVLPPNAFLISDITPGRAVHLGFEEYPGLKNTYYGKVTPHNVEKISQMIENKELATGTDIFIVSTKAFSKNPELYSTLIDNPELYNLKPLKKGGIYEETERPMVVRTFEGPEPGGFELKPVEKNIDLTRPKNKMKPLDLSGMAQSHVGAGSSGKAISLMKEATDVSKSANIKTPTTTETKHTPSQGISLSTQSGKYDIDIEVTKYSYPPGTKLQTKTDIDLGLGEKSNTSNKLKSLSETNQVQKNVNDQLAITRQKQQGKLIDLTIQKTNLREDESAILKISESYKLDIVQKQKTEQTQTTKEIEIPGKPPGKLTGRIPDFDLFEEPKPKQRTKSVGKLKRIFFSWNVNTECVGGYLPGAELKIGKTIKPIRQHEALQRKVNRGVVQKRSRASKAEKLDKTTFSKLDKSVYKQPKKQGKFKLNL